MHIEINKFIDDLIEQFLHYNCNEYSKNTFKDFISYIYFTFEKQNKLNKNKYKRVQQSIINYVIANELAISQKIRGIRK